MVRNGSYVQITDVLNDYRLSLEAANRSPRTITWYMDILNRFFRFLNSKNLLKPIHELGRGELRAYVVHLQSSQRWPNNRCIRRDRGKLSPYSIQGHVRAIRAFWSWLLHEGYICKNPLGSFPLPKVPQTRIKTITPQQFEALLTAIDTLSAIGAKYYSILLIFFDTGQRVSELTNLRMEDVDFKYGSIRVMGKGQKERVVFMIAFTRRQVTRYVGIFRPQLCPEESPFLFAGADGQAISVNSVQQYLHRLVKKAGLNGIKCSPHILRHTFATEYLKAGGESFYLQKIMGHSSLQTTLKYTHLEPQDIQEKHARFSPVSRLKIPSKARHG